MDPHLLRYFLLHCNTLHFRNLQENYPHPSRQEAQYHPSSLAVPIRSRKDKIHARRDALATSPHAGHRAHRGISQHLCQLQLLRAVLFLCRVSVCVPECLSLQRRREGTGVFSHRCRVYTGSADSLDL